MLKLVGCALIIGASAFLGFSVSRDLQKHLDEIIYLKQVIIMLKGEIRYSKAPLEEIFQSLSKKIRSPYNDWFASMADELSKKRFVTFYDTWSHQIELHLKKGYLKEQEIEQLKTLGTTMGFLDETMQLASLDLYMEELDYSAHKVKEEITVKKKLYNCLGVLGGIFVSIVLI